MRLPAVLLIAFATGAAAQDAAPPPASAPAPGSTAFCLFEAPVQNGRKPYLNLAHVQYVEVRDDEVRVYFGGGNLGSGHEARWPIKNRDEAAAQIKRMQDAARACR